MSGARRGRRRERRGADASLELYGVQSCCQTSSSPATQVGLTLPCQRNISMGLIVCWVLHSPGNCPARQLELQRVTTITAVSARMTTSKLSSRCGRRHIRRMTKEISALMKTPVFTCLLAGSEVLSVTFAWDVVLQLLGCLLHSR